MAGTGGDLAGWPPAPRHLPEPTFRPMTDDIPFNRNLALAPGRVEEVAPGVRRMLCDNPGPFTFKGTMGSSGGRGQVAIVDPGPDNVRHTDALLDAVRGEMVT